MTGMSRDPLIREKYTKERNAARRLICEYYEQFPRKLYQTEIESWSELQSQNIEFTIRRLARIQLSGMRETNTPFPNMASHSCALIPHGSPSGPHGFRLVAHAKTQHSVDAGHHRERPQGKGCEGRSAGGTFRT